MNQPAPNTDEMEFVHEDVDAIDEAQQPMAAAAGGGSGGVAIGARGPLPEQTRAPARPPQEQPFVRTDRKVGRNEPCPCGSGKKFKQCHGKLG